MIDVWRAKKILASNSWRAFFYSHYFFVILRGGQNSQEILASKFCSHQNFSRLPRRLSPGPGKREGLRPCCQCDCGTSCLQHRQSAHRWHLYSRVGTQLNTSAPLFKSKPLQSRVALTLAQFPRKCHARSGQHAPGHIHVLWPGPQPARPILPVRCSVPSTDSHDVAKRPRGLIQHKHVRANSVCMLFRA